MNIDVREAAIEEKPVLLNLLQLYMHDFADFEDDPADVDDEGRFAYPYLDAYWTEPERAPFLVRVKGQLAGFVLYRKHSYTGAGPDTSEFAEFCILRKYRRSGIGGYVARWFFDRYPGRWEVAELPGNGPAQAFWRRIIAEYTGGAFEEVWLANEEWTGPVQVFESQPA